MSIGSYCLVKNEKVFIQAHLDSWVDYLDSMVFYDGNSDDGTLEILKAFASNHPKVQVVENKDPMNLTYDYVRLSNEAMWRSPCDLVMFLHPDMFPENGQVLKDIPSGIVAATVNMRSFAGEPDGDIYEIVGRGTKWKNIYRLRNPDLGAHYHGFYGAQNEDTYFKEITGTEHKHFGQDFGSYAYPIHNTGLTIRHYSDVRTQLRRLKRMEKCLIHQGHTYAEAERLAPTHPRVSLKDCPDMKFYKCIKPYFMEGIKC